MTIKVCVVGLGYIGLPTATFIASKGFDVIGVDTNNEIIDKVNQGLSHFMNLISISCYKMLLIKEN